MRFSDEAVLRLVVAVVLGAIVGIEREVNDQPAGLRTHIAVCLGAAVFGVVSTLGFTEFEARRATTNVQIDVTRVASQVVVGIGFLGAGVIFRERTSVRNLTTAASLWVTAAIGLMAGVGDLGTAAAAAALLLAVLVALRPLRTFLRRRAPEAEPRPHHAAGRRRRRRHRRRRPQRARRRRGVARAVREGRRGADADVPDRGEARRRPRSAWWRCSWPSPTCGDLQPGAEAPD